MAEPYYISTKSSKTEKKVRSYFCTELKFPRVSGYLTVTNKRVIFHGVDRHETWLDELIEAIQKPFWFIADLNGSMYKGESKSRMSTEIELSTISGISSYYGTKTNIVRLILGLLFTIVPFIVYFGFRQQQSLLRNFDMHFGLWAEVLAAGIVIAAVIFGIWLLAFCRRQIFFLQIFSSQASGAPITIGEGIGNLGGTRAVCALAGNPTKHTDTMMKELGAIISDLKEMGDHAIELWDEKKKPTKSKGGHKT